MTASIWLALRYTTRHPVQSCLLAGALGLMVALPMALSHLVDVTDEELRSRARSTPMALGTRGSALDLALSGTHFRQPAPASFALAEARQAARPEEAWVLPLHLEFQARGAPIVGTELDYFELRDLRLQQGQWFARLGDCVLGARVAERLQLGVGDSLVSTPEQSFHLAGAYPLKMRIRGILEATGSADDSAVFVDLKTSWLIAGFAHGHQDLETVDEDSLLPSDEEDVLTANASVRTYQEVTEENADSFHFHGDLERLPISLALLWPNSDRDDALITSRFRDAELPLQMISPLDHIDGLLDTLFRMRSLALGLFAVTGVACLLITGLVFGLSFRLRRRQFQTLEDLGLSRAAISGVYLGEIALIASAAALLAGLLLAVVHRFGNQLIQWLLTL